MFPVNGQNDGCHRNASRFRVVEPQGVVTRTPLIKAPEIFGKILQAGSTPIVPVECRTTGRLSDALPEKQGCWSGKRSATAHCINECWRATATASVRFAE
jgi:hypothetical protein